VLYLEPILHLESNNEIGCFLSVQNNVIENIYPKMVEDKFNFKSNFIDIPCLIYNLLDNI